MTTKNEWIYAVANAVCDHLCLPRVGALTIDRYVAPRVEKLLGDLGEVGGLVAERDGAVRACSGLRKEVKGLNQAFRDAKAELRLLRRADRDPTGVEALYELRSLQDSVRAQLREQHTLRTRIGVLEKELRDAKASAQGELDEESAEVLCIADSLLDLSGTGGVLHQLAELFRAAVSRRRCQETRRSPERRIPRPGVPLERLVEQGCAQLDDATRGVLFARSEDYDAFKRSVGEQPSSVESLLDDQLDSQRLRAAAERVASEARLMLEGTGWHVVEVLRGKRDEIHPPSSGRGGSIVWTLRLERRGEFVEMVEERYRALVDRVVAWVAAGTPTEPRS